MECLLPHDALHAAAGGCRFYAGFSHTGTVELNNGVIGYVGWRVSERVPRIHRATVDS